MNLTEFGREALFSVSLAIAIIGLGILVIYTGGAIRDAVINRRLARWRSEGRLRPYVHPCTKPEHPGDPLAALEGRFNILSAEQIILESKLSKLESKLFRLKENQYDQGIGLNNHEDWLESLDDRVSNIENDIREESA